MPVGSCTRQSNAESAEHSPPSQMQRYKVIPPTKQNRDNIVQFQTSSMEDATNDKYGDHVGENYETPTTHHSVHQGSLLITVPSSFRPRLYTSKAMAAEPTCWLVPGARRRTGSANCCIRLSSSRAPSTPSRAHLGALLVTRERCRSYPGVQCELRRRRRDTCIRALSRMRTTFRVNADWCPS